MLSFRNVSIYLICTKVKEDWSFRTVCLFESNQVQQVFGANNITINKRIAVDNTVAVLIT